MLLKEQTDILDSYISNGGWASFYRDLPFTVLWPIMLIKEQDNLKQLITEYLQKNQIR